MRRHRAFAALIVSLSLVGCGLMRTPYTRPEVESPASYPHADATATASLDRWWQGFGDPQLDSLVTQARNRNSDLALAALNVRAAQLQAHLAVINPAIAVGYTYDYSAPLKRTLLPTPVTKFHSLTASASYEVDLWDQLAALKDVARWEARATEEDRQSAALSLIGTTVNLYYQLADLNFQLDTSRKSIVYTRRTLELVQVLKTAGGTTQLEIAESQQSLESQEAIETALVQQRIEVRNALKLLLNGISWSEESERPAVPESPPPPVAAGLPASLLKRRPDLRAAELRLREAVAQTDATRLSFYPNLSLTGSLGTASTGLSELVSNPLGSLAATLTAPLIQINQAHFATALARAQYDKAVVSFRKTLLQALIDVDNALSARTELAEQGGKLERSLESSKTAERLYEIRYRAGAVALRAWLDAQESRRQTELAVSANRLARVQNYIMLCQALGGGTEGLDSESTDRINLPNNRDQ
jgi:NodT family efflux transporter outer membrane factor (OMF) lipoprotein